MILINVKSDIYSDKRQFETDKKADKYLRLILKIHELSRLQKAGKRPRVKDYASGKRSVSKNRHAKAVKDWENTLRHSIPLKVEIINTKINQLSLTL